MTSNNDKIYQNLEININPFVSIFILTYNQQYFITQAIDSVLSQHTSYKFELIIADDNSSDNTLNICLDYYYRYPHIIRVISNNHNKGVLRNFHETVSLSRGKYISGVAGDDWWHNPNKLQIQVEFLEKNPDYGMVFGQTLAYSEKEGAVYSVYKSKRECTFGQLMMDNFVPAPTACYRKSLFDRYVQEVDPIAQQFVCEDYPMWIWFSHKMKFFRIEEPLATYRVLDNSLSHFTSPEKALDFEKKVFLIKLHMYKILRLSNDNLLHDIYLRFYYENMYVVSLVGDNDMENSRDLFFRDNGYYLLLFLSKLYKKKIVPTKSIKYVRRLHSLITKIRFHKYLKYDIIK